MKLKDKKVDFLVCYWNIKRVNVTNMLTGKGFLIIGKKITI